MDLQSLTQLFATTYDSNPNTRKAGELAVRKVRSRRVAAFILSSGFVLSAVIITKSLLVSFPSLPAKQA
jgi:hypothetical protein